MELDILLPTLSNQVQTKSLDITYKTGGEKKRSDQRGSLGPNEHHGGEFPEFSFCLIYLFGMLKELAIQKHHQAQIKKRAPTKA